MQIIISGIFSFDKEFCSLSFIFSARHGRAFDFVLNFLLIPSSEAGYNAKYIDILIPVYMLTVMNAR